MRVIKQSLSGGYVALGLSGTPKEIEQYHNFLYNYGVTDSNEPNTLGNDTFAFVAVKWDRFLRGMREMIKMSILRAATTSEERRHHQREANHILKQRMVKIKEERFLYNEVA